LAAAVGLLALALGGCSTTRMQSPKKLLVVTVTKGYRHSSIPTAEKALADLAAKSGAFTLDYVRTDQDMAEKMTAQALKQYDGVIFESTTGNLPLPDKAAFLDWIKSGKAFIGMHAATDTFHSQNGVDPYIEMIGGEFLKHGPQVTVECLNEDPKHPATRNIGKSWSVHDEIYQMTNFSRANVHGLLALDKHPNTGQPGYYPIAWCKTYGEGRVFYTSLGHREDVWTNAVYQAHILGGIKWALELEKGSAKPGDPGL
jgi:type 1 glutamine amidotransferase